MQRCECGRGTAFSKWGNRCIECVHDGVLKTKATPYRRDTDSIRDIDQMRYPKYGGGSKLKGEIPRPKQKPL